MTCAPRGCRGLIPHSIAQRKSVCRIANIPAVPMKHYFKPTGNTRHDPPSRLSRAPVVSIVSIRGRATGVGSELALASDMRFASGEKAILSQWEVGAGLVPGGGPMARLPRLIGGGRALEVLLGADDIQGDLAELYGYVNRALHGRGTRCFCQWACSADCFVRQTNHC
jgi:enoyl-CoA hydratase/carnithine racemase